MPISTTLDTCIYACERFLLEFGADLTLIPHSNVLRGWVNVERFHPESSCCMQHLRSDGSALFRTAVRSLAHNKTEFQDIATALQLYSSLRAQMLGVTEIRGDIEFLHDEHYLGRLFREDTPAWPDLIFGSFHHDLQLYTGQNFCPSKTPCFEDVKGLFGPKVTARHALKQLAEMYCIGPWMGIPYRRILQSTQITVSELDAGKKELQPPYAGCLEENMAIRLQIPLWKDGFQGCLYVALAGQIDQLKGDRDDLVAAFVRIANVMASSLAKERLRTAIAILIDDPQMEPQKSGAARANGAVQSMRPIVQEAHCVPPPTLGNLPRALKHLISPHDIEDVTVNEVPLQYGKDRSSSGATPSRQFTGRYQGLDLGVSIRLNERSPMFEADAELLSIEDRIDHFMYIVSMMHGMASRKPQALQLPVGNVSATAETVISERTDQELTMREYVPCFVALAILEKGTGKQIQVHGNMISMLHKKLREHYNITRRVSPGSDPDRPLAISQMIPNEETLREIESLIPGIALSRGHGSLIINFHTPSLGAAP